MPTLNNSQSSESSAHSVIVEQLIANLSAKMDAISNMSNKIDTLIANQGNLKEAITVVSLSFKNHSETTAKSLITIEEDMKQMKQTAVSPEKINYIEQRLHNLEEKVSKQDNTTEELKLDYTAQKSKTTIFIAIATSIITALLVTIITGPLKAIIK